MAEPFPELLLPPDPDIQLQGKGQASPYKQWPFLFFPSLPPVSPPPVRRVVCTVKVSFSGHAVSPLHFLYLYLLCSLS